MSGHSKWATIHRQKEIDDSKRGQAWTKVMHAVIVAIRAGGGIIDPNKNFKLRLAMDKGRSLNMPKENIQRAIGAASSAQSLEEAVYEGYGPSGVAFMVKVLTDNRNRTLPEIRRIFELHSGKMGEAGSAAYLFADPENPNFTVPITDPDLAQKVLALANALDEQEDVQEVFSNFDIPSELLEKLE